MWTMILTVGKHFFGLMDDFVRSLAWVLLLFVLVFTVSLKVVIVKHNHTLQKLTELQQSIATERESAAKTAAQMRDQAALEGERRAADLTRQNANLTVANTCCTMRNTMINQNICFRLTTAINRQPTNSPMKAPT